MKFVNVLTAAALAAITLPVLAQTTSTPRIDQRQQTQQQRIDQGAASGQLNQKEETRLEKGQARVQGMETKALADGTLTSKERRKIEHTQNQQSRKIYREKHDNQVTK